MRFAPALVPWAVPACALPLMAAYPPLDWRGLAWVSLAPVMVWLARSGVGVGRAALAGWGFGLLFTSFQLAWLPHALITVGGVPAVPATIFMTVTVVVLGLVPSAVFALACALKHLWRLSPLWSFAVIFAAADALLGAVPFGGIPWGTVAVTQVDSPAARAVVPVAGGSALVLVILLINGAWAWVWCRARATPSSAHGIFRFAAVLGMTLLLSTAWLLPGAASQLPSEASTPALGPADDGDSGPVVLLVPGDRPATVELPGSGVDQGLRYYMARTLASTGTGIAGAAALVIWPESAASRPVATGDALTVLSELAALAGADLLLGSDARDEGRITNAAYLVSADGFNGVRYDKRVRVPFGEFVPWGFGWLWGRKITAGSEDYVAGTALPVMAWRGAQLGMAICFESILPRHMRGAVRAGAQVIVVMANDQWLTRSAADQHVGLTALQGLATGRDVLFVANGGWAAHLRQGRTLTRVWGSGEPLRIRPALRSERTPWVRWGYMPFAVICGVILLLGVMITGPRTRQSPISKQDGR